MIKKSVSIYDRGADGLYLHPSAYTDMGVLLAVPPFEHVRADEKHTSLWKKVVELLDRSGGIIPHPKKWDQLDPMIKTAGCKNWKDFAKKATYCSVDVADDKYVFTPGEWDGKGFNEIESEAVIVENNESERVYVEALLKALELK